MSVFSRSSSDDFNDVPPTISSPLALCRSQTLSDEIAVKEAAGKKRISEVVQEWIELGEQVERGLADKKARDLRSISGAPPTADDLEFNAWFSVYAILENKAGLSLTEREYFREAYDIAGVKKAIAHCEKIIEDRKEFTDAQRIQEARDGTSPNITAEGGEFY